MPPAVLIPAAVSGALGIAGMISQNANNKAAQKNNDNQQAANVQATQNAKQQALQGLQQFLKSNPAPNASVAKPGQVQGAAPTGGGMVANPMAPTAQSIGRMPQQAPQAPPPGSNQPLRMGTLSNMQAPQPPQSMQTQPAMQQAPQAAASLTPAIMNTQPIPSPPTYLGKYAGNVMQSIMKMAAA